MSLEFSFEEVTINNLIDDATKSLSKILKILETMDILNDINNPTLKIWEDARELKKIFMLDVAKRAVREYLGE